LTINYAALNSYIDEVREQAFMWHVHDCFMFTNECFRRMYGVGYADDWAGRYISGGLYMRREQLAEEFGFASLEDALDSKLARVNCFPPRGALVTAPGLNIWDINKALGISLGNKAVFLGKKKLSFLRIAKIENAWIKK
jgi:hypothetical protein